MSYQGIVIYAFVLGMLTGAVLSTWLWGWFTRRMLRQARGRRER